MKPTPHSNDPTTADARVVAMMVTRRCNMTCGHCSVESGPQVKGEPSFEELCARVTAAAANGVHSILFTGGEPMLRKKELLALFRLATRLGIAPYLATNGFWAGTLEQADHTLRQLRRAGLRGMTISPDRYHAPFQGIDYSLNVARAAAARGVPLNVNLTRAVNDDDLDPVLTAFEQNGVVKDHVRLRFFDVQPVGRARGFERLRGENDGFCASCRVPAVTDDGRVTACNGPSYFAPEGSPLLIGSLRTQSLAELMRQHATDPLLETIRTFGVSRLRDELRQIPGFEQFPFRAHYHGMCELCAHITSDGPAVAALRSRLGADGPAAERTAKLRVLNGHRDDGPRHFASLNSIERARVFWAVGHGLPWPAHSDRVLGRADFDWKRAVDYLSNCGLARPLAPRLDDPELVRWAPRFFVDRLRARATRDALRDFVMREILARLSDALDEIGADGVLLKSAARLARTSSGDVTRAASDVDVWVAPAHATALRELLLARGFSGESDARRTGAHHLAHVLYRGVPVEIHTRLLPEFWGLPERQMLERRAVTALPRLATLDTEATLLHAVVHCTSHLFSHGLKAAWDVGECLRTDQVDWERLSRWVDLVSAPRAFWSLFGAFTRDLGFRAPDQFLANAPRDLKELRLETIASRRAFSAIDVAEELNPFSKNAVFLMLCDRSSARARLLFSLMGRNAVEARKSGWRYVARQSSTPLREHLRLQWAEAWDQWKHYRAVVSSPQFRERAARAVSSRA